MSGIISMPIARAPRQSGLKKPRPLRSISLQEAPGQNIKKEKPERQLSSGYPSHSNALNDHQDVCASSSKFCSEPDFGCDSFQNLALENGGGFGRADSSGSLTSSQEIITPSSHFQRQNSAASQDSSASSSRGHSRKSSMESNSQLSGSGTVKSDILSLDANANKVNRSVGSESESSGDSPESRSISSLHKERFKDNSGSPEKPEDKKSKSDNITLATLATPKGKQIVLSGTCIQTVLNACKVLLQEMGASIVRLETVENPDAKKTTDISPDSPTDSSPALKSRLQYSKDELLALSESKLSRKPPAMWNILAPTHADCCIPAYQLLEYFEPVDFHPHDGTLAVGEYKKRERWD